MFQGSLFGSNVRAGIHRQAYRVYESVSGRSFHAFWQIPREARAFSGLVKNSQIEKHLESSVLRNLGMKLGLVRVVENVSLPFALSFKSFIHFTEQGDVGAGGTRSRRSTEYSQGLHQEARYGVNGGSPPYQTQVEQGRTSRSIDYVQGLLHERGNDVNGRPPLDMPRVGAGRTLRSSDHVPGLLQERGNGFSGRPPLYQPQVESNADIVHIKLKRNNSFVTLTDSKGNRKVGTTGAIAAGKGDKPGRYSGEAAAEYIGRKVREMKTKSTVVKVNGLTFFRRKKDSILAFKDGYTNSRGDMNPVVYIEDTTRKPHNGCRLPKKRRI